MRVWVGGPRIFGHRTGVSFGPEDFRRIRQQQPVMAGRRPSAFVYVVRRMDNGHVKIGFTADPIANLAALQRGSSTLLELDYACAVKSNNGYAVEQAAHAMLDRHRLEGEWFDVSPDMAVAAIAAAAHRLSDPVVEIPKDKIRDVLALAAMQDATAKPKKASLLMAATGVVVGGIVGVIFALIIQVIIIMARSPS